MPDKAIQPLALTEEYANHLIDTLREAVLNLDSLESEVKSIKRRIVQHLESLND